MKNTTYNSNGDINKVIARAREIATDLVHEYITVEHLLLSIAYERSFHTLLDNLGVQIEPMIDEIEDYLANQPVYVNNSDSDEDYEPKKTVGLERVFNRAYTQVLFSRRKNLSILDLYLSINNEAHSYAAYFLKKYGVVKEDVAKSWGKVKQTPGSGSSGDAQKTMETYCTNMMTLAAEKKFDPVIGRDTEIADVVQILARKNKSNVLLVGDAGTGKTSIVEGLVLEIAEDRVPTFLKGWSVYSLNIGQLLAGTKFRGEFEERLQDILTAAAEIKNVILFIDEAHQMRGAGGGNNSPVDLANMIKPALARGELKVIASTTWEEYSQHFEKDRALMRRFNRVTVSEPTPGVTIQILTGLKERYEQFHSVSITDAAIKMAVDLSVRFQTDKRLPDKAIDLIDSAAALKRSTDAEERVVDVLEIQRELSRMTGIPVNQLEDQKNSVDITTVEDDIRAKVYGQDEAVTTILNQVWINKAGLGTPNKPIGSFLLLGPTGVGKTEFAIQLSERLSMKLLRFDMSEYMEKHSVSRLIGAPPGYVGYEDSNLSGGLLISEVDRNPYSIVLIDEVEKAHPDVLQVLLQIMDNGFATGSNGKKADFRNTLVLLTSNLGAADNERNTMGFTKSLTRTGEDDKAVGEFFRPEFRNRLNGIVKFGALSTDVIRKVSEKFIAQMQSQLIDRELTVTLTDATWDYLVKNGYDVKMGARPMGRLIDEKIKVPLARKILFDKIANGKSITIDIVDDNVEFLVNEA